MISSRCCVVGIPGIRHLVACMAREEDLGLLILKCDRLVTVSSDSSTSRQSQRHALGWSILCVEDFEVKSQFIWLSDSLRLRWGKRTRKIGHDPSGSPNLSHHSLPISLVPWRVKPTDSGGGIKCLSHIPCLWLRLRTTNIELVHLLSNCEIITICEVERVSLECPVL